MRQATLHEQIITLSPTAAPPRGPLTGMPSPEEPASTPTRQRSTKGMARDVGSVVMFTLRTVGAVLGVVVAALTVAALVAVQEILGFG